MERDVHSKRIEKEAAMTEIQEKLFSMQDLSYKEFHSKLMPTVNSDKIIGVRTPELRKLAKAFAKSKESKDFLMELPHKYYEEDNLHGFIIEELKDYEETIDEVERFLPYVDNWATCDMMSPKVFKKNTDKLRFKINQWIKSEDTYTVRFGIDIMMKYYLDEEFMPEYLQMIADIKSDEYYINMAIAWYFATALAKQYDAALPYIEKNKLDKWIHNKTIQKAVESYRLSTEQKTYLKTFKLK